MSDWRQQVLKEIDSGDRRISLVFDPDELLLDEKVLAKIHAEGSELINYDDHVNFRFIFESRFRSKWDAGEDTEAHLVIRTDQKDDVALPFDIVSSSRRSSVDLASMFPNLAYQVVAAVPKTELDALFEACRDSGSVKPGMSASMDFILLHVYEVAPELIKHPEDLLKFLFRRHYRNQVIPELLENRLLERLSKVPAFGDWPLERIVRSRNAFFEFIQERWPLFVRKFQLSGGTGEDSQPRDHPEMKYGGPVELPFDSHDIRVYLDNMFVEGMLSPVDADSPGQPLPQWVTIGVRNSDASHIIHKIDLLLANIEKDIPNERSQVSQWEAFAYRWAELLVLRHGENIHLPEILTDRISRAQDTLDAGFQTWMLSRYSGLNAMAPFPPVMVSHIPRYLSRRLSQGVGNKVLFILVDGMAMDQWLVIRKSMAEMAPALRFDEKAVFAWAPTLTSFSRQSAFAGKAPMFFPSTIFSTDREKSHWKNFWNDHGLKSDAAGFEKFASELDRKLLGSMIDDPGVRALGLILTQVDSIMHGACLGSAGMLDQVRLWAANGDLMWIVQRAISEGYEIYISSDHGNVESVGVGKPGEGVEAELRGHRVRVFDNADSRARIKAQFPETIEWPAAGLPENCFSLFAHGRSAFTARGERVVTHGGLSMQEVIVPFVRVGLD